MRVARTVGFTSVIALHESVLSQREGGGMGHASTSIIGYLFNTVSGALVTQKTRTNSSGTGNEFSVSFEQPISENDRLTKSQALCVFGILQ